MARRRVGRLPDARDGTPLRETPSGFPLYFSTRKPRVVTSDVWAYFRYLATATLPSKEEHEAVSFIDQSLEFFEADGTPRIGSRPLLFYYSFLNLAKAVLLLQGVRLPVKTQHGIFYPQDNVRSRLRFSGQKVGFEKAAKNHSKLFPEFVRSLGGNISATTLKKVLPLFRQIPAVHRTYCRVTGEKPSFLPVKAFELLRRGNKIHARLILSKHDADVQATLPTLQSRQAFRRVFKRVHPAENAEIWFQTSEVRAVKRGTDAAIRKLSESIRQIGLWPILTLQGHRYYFGTFPPSRSIWDRSRGTNPTIFIGSCRSSRGLSGSSSRLSQCSFSTGPLASWEESMWFGPFPLSINRSKRGK
jgi:hypothetical protein